MYSSFAYEDVKVSKLTLQMDAVLVPAGMPSMPGMEDRMKKKMLTGLETSLQTIKKIIEG